MSTIHQYQPNGFYNSYFKHNNLFYGYCSKCNHFDHKVANCRLSIKPTNFMHKNAFAPLLKYDVECYKYHNLSHIAKFCKSMIPKEENNQISEESYSLNKSNSEARPKLKKVWKEKHVNVH